MKQKDFLLILIPAFFLTVLWVVFSIYHNYVTSTVKAPLTFQILGIPGKFDTETINKLKSRQKIDPLYEIQNIPSVTPEPSATPSIEASPSGEEILQ